MTTNKIVRAVTKNAASVKTKGIPPGAKFDPRTGKISTYGRAAGTARRAGGKAKILRAVKARKK